MKIRLHKNSLRLRLSQSEVAALTEHKALEERFDFPNAPLTISLETAASNSAQFDKNRIRIAADLADWLRSDREGIEFADGVNIAIEKDFQCLHRASPEDADSFPNPMLDRL